MDSGDFLSSLLFRVIERVFHNVARSCFGNRLQGNTRIGKNRTTRTLLHKINKRGGFRRAFLEFNACVQIFRVFTHDNQVNVIVAPTRTGKRHNGTQAHVQLKRLAQRNVHAAKPCTHRRGDRAFDSHAIATNGFQCRFRQQCAVRLQACSTCRSNFPLNRCTRRINNALHGGRRFHANAIAWNQSYRMFSHNNAFLQYTVKRDYTTGIKNGEPKARHRCYLARLSTIV